MEISKKQKPTRVVLESAATQNSEHHLILNEVDEPSSENIISNLRSEPEISYE